LSCDFVSDVHDPLHRKTRYCNIQPLMNIFIVIKRINIRAIVSYKVKVSSLLGQNDFLPKKSVQILLLCCSFSVVLGGRDLYSPTSSQKRNKIFSIEDLYKSKLNKRNCTSTPISWLINFNPNQNGVHTKIILGQFTAEYSEV
jgi:hypothetical protein